MKILATILIFCGLSFAQGTELLRPTADAATGAATSWSNSHCSIGSYSGSSSLPLAYDTGGLTTSSLLTVSSTTTTKVAVRTFMSWTATANTYTALTLNVSAKNANNDGGTSAVVYSVDGGSTWTLLTGTSQLQSTTTVAINAGLDLSKLRVGVCASGTGLGPGTGTGSLTIYDIWTSGTLGSPAAGNGSSSGTAVQPVQFN